MKLKTKLKKLSVNTNCVVDFKTYGKAGKPIELLESLTEEELNREVKLTVYTIFYGGATEIRIRLE